MRIDNKILIAAARLFERDNGNMLGGSDNQAILNAGLNDIDSREVVHHIVDFLSHADDDDPLVGSALFALAKRYDYDLKELFIAMLRKTLDSNPHGLFQALIGLDNLGEGTLPDGGSVAEYNRNRNLAIKYLKRIA